MGRVLYQWKTCEVGRKGLCLILQAAHAKATDAQLCHGHPKDYGISGEYLLSYVNQRLPQLAADHQTKTGQPLTGKKMMARLYHMFDGPDGGKRLGREHPSLHEDLVGTWLAVSGQQADMFSKGEPDEQSRD